jgi:ketosteroid isomerase-like protein
MTSPAQEVARLEEEWSRAMIRNNPEAIGRFMSDDWTIIGPDGRVSDKAGFLELVRSGVLTHDLMQIGDLQVRIYGDAAVVTGRGVSGGTYHGQAFRAMERVFDVWVRQDGRWRCVLTHLSRIADQDG